MLTNINMAVSSVTTKSQFKSPPIFPDLRYYIGDEQCRGALLVPFSVGADQRFSQIFIMSTFDTNFYLLVTRYKVNLVDHLVVYKLQKGSYIPRPFNDNPCST